MARLSGLYSTLTARQSLHESLLSLSGRLDTILLQVEYRASRAPAVLNRENAVEAKQETTVRRYVEGESESDREMDVEVEEGEDEGSVEDIELGVNSGSSEEDGDDSDIDQFIDDEAEEEEEDYTDEDEEDSD